MSVLPSLCRFPHQDEQPLNNGSIVVRSRYETLVSCCFSPNFLTNLNSALLSCFCCFAVSCLAIDHVDTHLKSPGPKCPPPPIQEDNNFVVYEKYYFYCTNGIILNVPGISFLLYCIIYYLAYQRLYDPSPRQYWSTRASFCCSTRLP